MKSRLRVTVGIFASFFSFYLASVEQSAQAQVFDRDYTQGSDVYARGSLGLFSDREFRGQNLYDGSSLQFAPQVGLGTEIGVLYVGGFAHFAVDNQDEPVTPRKSFNEYDFELGDILKFDEFNIAVGHRWYTYSRSNPRLKDTGELFAELTTEIIAHPHFNVEYDDIRHNGWYYEFGLEQPVSLGLQNEHDAVVPSVTMGMSSGLDNGPNAIYADDGIAFVDVGLKGIFTLADGVFVEPEMHYVEEVDDATDSEFTFGVNFVGRTGSIQ
ncbi:MAG: hypothetical protein U0136_19315 [Bdellovibrionota bacterium]